MQQEQPVNIKLLQALSDLHNLLGRLETSASFARSEAKDNRPEVAWFYLSAISSGVEKITHELPLMMQAIRAMNDQSGGLVGGMITTYTDLSGNNVTVYNLKWLENARYFKPSDPADDATGEWLPCSLYRIGTDEDGDDLTVCLNGDMQEVKAS